MLIAVVAVVLVAALAGFVIWLGRALAALRVDSAAQLEGRNAEVDRRLQGVIETMDRRLGELDTKVDRRLEQASKQTNAIHKQLGDVGRATANLAD